MYKMILYFFSLMLFSSAVFAENYKLSSAPYISGNSFRAIANHILDEGENIYNLFVIWDMVEKQIIENPFQKIDPYSVKDKDIIFVRTEFIEAFFSKIHPLIQNRYILITHNSDAGSPGKFISYLDDPKIIKWFGVNPTVKNHSKFVAIPIGFANRCWPHGCIDSFNDFKNMCINEKHFFVGINFETWTNPALRKPLFDKVSAWKFCDQIYSKSHKDYLINMSKSKFVLSPQGNGLDCHRNWEALFVGCIPIVKSSYLDDVFKNFQVLIINDWDELTEEFLNKKYKELSKLSSNKEKLMFNYWLDLILACKNLV